MISTLRRLITSRWGAIIAIGFVIMLGIAFVLGDVTGSSSFGGLGQGYVAKVGSEKIGIAELQDAVDNRLRAERRQNPTLDRGRFIEGGGLDVTLEQLINRYAIAAFGDRYGIAVSAGLVNKEILKIPGAIGSNGKFDQQAFNAFLQELKLSEKMVRDDFRQNFYARQLLFTSTPGGPAPMSMALPYASLDLERRTGEVALIPSLSFMPKDPPSDAVLNKYFRDNATRYTIPERRSISYAIFDASVVDSKATPSTDEIAAYYKSNAAKYAATQTRDIAQLVFPTQAAAKTAADQVAGGKSLDAVASSLGLSVTRTSGVTKAKLTSSASKAVADAVFAASQGGVSAPARGALGYYVVSVSKVNNIAARPLAAVSGEIARELKEQKKVELLGDLTAEIENAFDEGSTIADVAKANGLKVETTPKLLGNGQNPTNPGYQLVPEMKIILPSAFQMETDGSGQLVELEEGKRFALVSVADFDEAAPPPLSEIRMLVAQQWGLAEGNKKAKATAEQIRKAVTAGQSLSAALAATGVPGTSMQSLSGTRGELRKPGQQVAPPLALMFSMKRGTAKTLQGAEERGWFVVHLNEVIRGDASKDAERLAENRKQLQMILSQEYAAQLILAAKKEVGVTQNESAIKALRDSLTGANEAK